MSENMQESYDEYINIDKEQIVQVEDEEKTHSLHY